jgi:hypothetical protein
VSSVRRRVFRDVHEGRDKIIVQTVQDVEEIKKINEITRLANGSGTSSFWKKRHWVKIASIPNILIDQWHREGIRFADPNCWPEIKKRLNDNDYLSLRTAPGRF